MSNCSNCLLHLLFFYVLLGEPYIAGWLYRTFIINLYFQPRARIDYYFQKISIHWILIGLIATIGLTIHPGSAIVWIGSLNSKALGLLLAVLVAAVIGLLLLVYWDKLSRPFLAVTSLTPSILPTNQSERMVYTFMAFSAGLGEELVYRGFLWFYLRVIFPVLPVWSLIVLSTLLYTAGHYYQYRLSAKKNRAWWSGISMLGLFGNLIMGLVYGLMVAFSGSLVPSIVLHSLYDMNAVLVKPVWGIPNYHRNQEPTRIGRLF